MKASYIKTKNTNDLILTVPELTSMYYDIVSKYIDDDGYKYESYVSVVNFDENGEFIEDNLFEEGFMFMDEETTSNVISFLSEYGLLVEYKDITNEVKHFKCEMDVFKKTFDLEVSMSNIDVLYTFITEYTTSDDILEKVKLYGKDSLIEFDLDILRSTSGRFPDEMI